MFKTISLVAALALPLAFGGYSSPAEAKTNVQLGIFFGEPHFRFQPDSDWEFRRGYGWYHPNQGKLSCYQAKLRVANRGYNRVRTIECNGRTYTFTGVRRGDRFRIYVNSRTGSVWSA